MQFTPRVHKAIKKAALWHDGHVRKGDRQTPYIGHLFSVASILAEYTDNENIIIAGLLHDVLEDMSLSYAEDIKDLFGPRVLQLVKEVSEDKDPEAQEERPWQKRKEEYLAGLKECSTGALYISCADKIHNLLSLRRAVKESGKEVLDAFSSSAKDRMRFYGKVLEIVEERLDNSIKEQLAEELEKKRLYTKAKY